MYKDIVMSKNIYKTINIFLIIVLFALCLHSIVDADITSTTYSIKEYDFGSGGKLSNTSTTYSLYGNTGQLDGLQLTSTTYFGLPGLTYQLTSNVPTAPTITTPGMNYDRIKITLATSSNPTDALYAIQISTTSDFSSNVYYAKFATFTIGTTLTSNDFQTNANWGSSGFFISGLSQNTTYYVRVKARQGLYTESAWGPSVSITTNQPQLAFSLSSNTVNFVNLNTADSFTDSAESTTLTATTSAYGGYVVYGHVNQVLTNTQDGTKTIANYTSPNSAPTSWSGTGFGYTTNNTNLTGSGGANRFSNGTLYAGFGLSGLGDPVASDLGPVTNTEISNENFIVSYRITTSNTQAPGTYTNTILYSIVPTW